MPRRLAALALGLALAAGRVGADEWDIFDAATTPEAEADAGSGDAGSGDAEPGDVGLSLLAEAPRHRVSADLRARYLASSLADLSPPESDGGLSGESFDFSFLYGVQARSGRGPLSLFADLAFVSSDSGAVAVEGQDDHPDLAFARLVVERLDLRLVAAEALHLDIGILPLRFGNGLYFNPVDVLARSLADPEASGASSYPAIQVTLLGSVLSASLSYVPYHDGLLEALARSIPGAFQQAYDGHIAAASAGGFLLGVNLSALGFLRVGGEGDDAYALGLELQSPLGRYANLCAQALVSKGQAAYEAAPLGAASFMGERASSLDEALVDAYLELDLALTAGASLRLAYRYQQRGLSAAEFGSVVEGLMVSDPFLDLRRDAALGLSYSPLPFLRHSAVAGLVVPELARSLSASLVAMSALVDPSLGVYVSLDYAAGEAATLSLSGACAIGAEGSAFGLVREEASLMLSLDLFL